MENSLMEEEEIIMEILMNLNKILLQTRGIKNCRDSWLFKGCSPLKLLCNLTGHRPQSATFHTAKRWQQVY